MKNILSATVVPQPQKLTYGTMYYAVEKESLNFKVYPKDHEIISFNVERFLKNTFLRPVTFVYPLEIITEISISYTRCDTPLTQSQDESYQIFISKDGVKITSNTCFGSIRALDTLMQLIVYEPVDDFYFVRECTVIDFPRFHFRGFLLDTSRHFLPVSKITEFMEIAAIAKLNVFHWHIVDDPSFPYVSEKYPNISVYGSRNLNDRYSQWDVRYIIKYAEKLGIVVMPEFDTPGHAASWHAIPNFNTMCGDKFGPTNPILEQNYAFLADLFEELRRVFPSDYFHLGGDEVDHTCWMNDPTIYNWMIKNKMQNASQLQTYYALRILKQTKDLWKNVLVWQEVFFDEKDPSVFRKIQNMVVNVWIQSENNSFTKIVVENGFKVVYGPCWYLNYIETWEAWSKWYRCDPHDEIDKDKEHLVIGGTISMWGERIFPTNLIERSWIRAFVPAERLWSDRSVRNETDFSVRAFNLYCDLLRMGYPVIDIENSRDCAIDELANNAEVNINKEDW